MYDVGKGGSELAQSPRPKYDMSVPYFPFVRVHGSHKPVSWSLLKNSRGARARGALMSDAYKNVKSGRLVFKGGDVAGADKKKRKKKKRAEAEAEDNAEDNPAHIVSADGEEVAAEAGGGVYTIDAAKKMKYEELFPVEAKKFGYDPANKSRTGARTVEEALDDRVKKKADRYCK